MRHHWSGEGGHKMSAAKTQKKNDIQTMTPSLESIQRELGTVETGSPSTIASANLNIQKLK